MHPVRTAAPLAGRVPVPRGIAGKTRHYVFVCFPRRSQIGCSHRDFHVI